MKGKTWLRSLGIKTLATRWALMTLSSLGLILLLLHLCAPSPQEPLGTDVPSNLPTMTQPTPPQVSAERLMQSVQDLAYERFAPKDRQRARDYLIQSLTTWGWNPTAQPYASGVNIKASRLGTDPRAGNILVAAHYDTVPNTPGADDNGSGVAVVLEVARLLKDIATPRTLQIALFDEEEMGLIGSYAYADEASNLTDLHGAIVLEMVGYTCQTPGCQRQPEGLLQVRPPSNVGDFLAVVGDAETPELLQAFENEQSPEHPSLLALSIPLKGVLTPVVLRSDHVPFWYKDVGAVMVTDTAFLRNPHYHQPTDRPETLDPVFLQQSAQMVVNATLALLSPSADKT
ncbi:M20/M25/M40 family metallo-hydrolase [Synechococcales cyanobacterium C]|uniref:M20/M25/M40 family metallo-hydrolase n=1 Tax=Petrachloros mirabilis ULC683 TaxID=2781853 RepID=A0A8K1ZYF5_9CYAN|nr:M20/M25/M40 family metallo-hydrolase [Petrachloros mirabilis]NCJ06152.1 M20/M25/M40 family metallo-hydrolase [Petrachloros mirabilis ULC683]